MEVEKNIASNKYQMANNITTIHIPAGCRYMGEYKEKLLGEKLPLNQKFILNKTVPGCGGTSMFLESEIPMVLISPRLNVLKSKHAQYIDTFLFYVPYSAKDSSEKRANDVKSKMSELHQYIQERMSLNPNKPSIKILVSIDSSSKVLDVLDSFKITRKMLYVCDEFQCLLGDASYKGDTDMDFLVQIDKRADKICYLSATPIQEMYLECIPQFKNIPYIKLEWDPSVLEDPNVMECQMKRGETAESICETIIRDFRKNGYFARKVMPNGTVEEAKEICIFLNEVKSIVSIIKRCGLKPDEVSILCSESRGNKLPAGFSVGQLCTDKNNPINKTYTFCTKASFEGVDFYHTSAITYIFLNAGKEWQALDVFIDLPQILGRQRLNHPFRHDAIIYYKTKPSCQTDEEFKEEQEAMQAKSEKDLETFNNLSEKGKQMMIQAYRKMAQESKFTEDYIDVIDNGDGNPVLGINHLVCVAKWNKWYHRRHLYNNSFQLIASIQQKLSMNVKPKEVKDFEQWYYKQPANGRLLGYVNFRKNYPQYKAYILQNPFIDLRYHEWYDKLGPNTIEKLKGNEAQVESEYNNLSVMTPVKQEVEKTFKKGKVYLKADVKRELQRIYDKCGMVGRTAKATDITVLLDVKEKMITNGGKRLSGYEIL